MKQWLGWLVISMAMGLFAQSGEEQAARQARSVHLVYQEGREPVEIFYCEATPLQSAPGTYFCVLAFDAGYTGFQELTDGTQIVLFSVWDPGDAHNFAARPDQVEEAQRTSLYYVGEGVEARRFGGEGTGGQSKMRFAWRIGQPVRMAVSCVADGKHRKAYTGWVWRDETQEWFRIATFSSLVGADKPGLTGPYSFVEDFFRNVQSKYKVRAARFSRLWSCSKGWWTPSPRARFSADNNLLETIDCGPAPDGYWLATGGTITNATTKLWQTLAPGGAPDDSEAIRGRLLEAVKAANTPPPAP